MRRTVPPSAEIQARIDELLGVGVPVTDAEGALSELAHLGAQLILQRAVEEEFDAFLGRERYERRLDALPGKRNGWRARHVQTTEGELTVEIPQVREAAETFVSKLFPRESKRLITTEPLKAMVVGAFVRGLSMRDVESLCDEAGLGQVSASTASRICQELKDRYRAFRERDRSGIELVVLYLDAIYLPVRPTGNKEGVLCAWGIDTDGKRVLLDVCLGMRESEEDSLSLGRGLTARGLKEPMMVVCDGAPGLNNAIEQLWPTTDRQRCTVHRLPNLLAKLPDDHHELVRSRYWQALDEATGQRDGERRLRELVGWLSDQGLASAATCLADDLEALCAHLRYPLKHRRRWRSTNLLERSLGEVRRRTKVIGRFPDETNCLSLCRAVLDLIITHSNKHHAHRPRTDPPPTATRAASHVDTRGGDRRLSSHQEPTPQRSYNSSGTRPTQTSNLEIKSASFAGQLQ